VATKRPGFITWRKNRQLTFTYEKETGGVKSGRADVEGHARKLRLNERSRINITGWQAKRRSILEKHCLVTGGNGIRGFRDCHTPGERRF